MRAEEMGATNDERSAPKIENQQVNSGIACTDPPAVLSTGNLGGRKSQPDSCRKDRVSLDMLLRNRVTPQANKPHKANDAAWDAIQATREKDGEITLTHFKLIRRLGCGDIGSVYLAELRGSKLRFAMKIMDLKSLKTRRKQSRAETERDILATLDHPFLPTLYAHFQTKDFMCLVMEYCSNGDLHTLRQRQPNRSFASKSARFYAAELLLALEYLHMLGIVYRDLKPENVLVRGDGHVMLSDFDLSLKCAVHPTLLMRSIPELRKAARLSTKQPKSIGKTFLCSTPNACVPLRRRVVAAPSVPKNISENEPGVKSKDFLKQIFPLPELVAEPTGVRSMSFVGTHEYLAPEIVAGNGHGSAVDWWTFGILLYELMYGKTPFKGEDNEITLVNVVNNPLEFPLPGTHHYREVDESAKDLIKALLEKDPQKRLGYKRGAAELKQHPFFEKVNWALIRCTVPPPIPKYAKEDRGRRELDQELDFVVRPLPYKFTKEDHHAHQEKEKEKKKKIARDRDTNKTDQIEFY